MTTTTSFVTLKNMNTSKRAFYHGLERAAKENRRKAYASYESQRPLKCLCCENIGHTQRHCGETL